MKITVGVLALQGAFHEHLVLLQKAGQSIAGDTNRGAEATTWNFIEVRNAEQLSICDALIIPGGESTTIALVAARSDLLDPLRDFVKYAILISGTTHSGRANRKTCRVQRKPTWGTCAGLILLAESANRIKQGGQDLIGGLDVRVNRNHFGRQVESFQAPLDLTFVENAEGMPIGPFPGVFIRAPVVEKILPTVQGVQIREQEKSEMVVAPSRNSAGEEVEIMATLPGRAARLATRGIDIAAEDEAGDIIAVRQGNVFGTSFHPELTGDARIHVWWLQQVRDAIMKG